MRFQSSPGVSCRELPGSAAHSDKFEYHEKWRTLVIEEAASRQGGYGFVNAFRPLPPTGQASLDCDLCQNIA